MNISELSLRRPVTTMMVFLCLVVLGGISAKMIPLEQFPDVQFPGIFINVPYPGSSPAEVERIITRPIEEVLGTVSDVKEMQSTSREGGTNIMLFFDWETDVSIKAIQVREKLDGIRDELPSDVERYFINMFSTSDDALLEYRISTTRDLSNSYEMLDRNLKQRLERIDGVGKVDVFGVERKEVRIELISDRLSAHSIDLGKLTQQLRNSNFSFSAGKITDGKKRFVVRPVGELQTVEEIGNQVINARGIRLRDIADITYQSPKLDFGRHLDGNYAVGLEIFKASGKNTVAVARAVKDEIEEIKKLDEMEGIALVGFDDQAESVLTSLQDLLKSGLMGAILSFIILYAFLRQLTTTLIVALAVPIALLITVVGLYFTGFTLNILSLMGLMLAVGMLVDNAVVVTENIYRHRALGEDRDTATLKGVKEVGMAVTAGTLTTAIVFLPFLFSGQNEVTLFLKHVALTICIALGASLLIAQTVIPILTKKVKSEPKKKTQTSALTEWYGRVLTWAVDHKGWSSLGVLLILVSVAIPVSFVDQEMFPDQEGRDIELTYRLNGTYPLEQVEEAVNTFEEYFLANKERFEIETVYTYYSPDYAETDLILVDEDESKMDIEELKEMIREGLPKVAIANPSFEGWQGMGGGDAGVSISITGESSDQLMELLPSVERSLEQITGLKDVHSGERHASNEIQVVVDRERTRQLGLSTQEVASSISAAMRGLNLRRIRGEDGEVDVRLAFQGADKQRVEDLKNIPIVTPSGTRVSLASLARFENKRAPQAINHDARVTELRVSATLDDITTDEAQEKIAAVMDRFPFPSGYGWSFGRRFQREDETGSIMLINLLLALILIYIVMAGLFESLITPAAIWSSILFAIVGVYWFFLITGTSFSLMAWIGILILVGIIVNNGIVLLDQVIQLRNQGLDRREALIQGGKDRIRPILMTAGTTVLGLVPLCFGTSQIGGGGPPYFPMARAIVGGLTFSTVVTLLVLPTIYMLLDDLSIWGKKTFSYATRADD